MKLKLVYLHSSIRVGAIGDTVLFKDSDFILTHEGSHIRISSIKNPKDSTCTPLFNVRYWVEMPSDEKPVKAPKKA